MLDLDAFGLVALCDSAPALDLQNVPFGFEFSLLSTPTRHVGFRAPPFPSYGFARYMCCFFSIFF